MATSLHTVSQVTGKEESLGVLLKMLTGVFILQ
jgi:hypothetical protein